jgi:predicted amidohydrolase
MAPQIGRKDRNVAQSLLLIERAAAEGAQVVVLPELCNTGYVFSGRDEALGLAELVPDGPTTTAWAELARRLGIVIVAGIAELEGEHLFNSSVVLGPRGLIGKYRKLHLWNDEHRIFEPGNLGLPFFDTPVGRIATLICYDGWFPEVYRHFATHDVDLVCVPTNWVPMPGSPKEGLAMAHMLTVANAHTSALTVACANRVGSERGQSFIGQSVIVGAGGHLLAGPASAACEEVLVTHVDLGQAREARQFNSFNNAMRDRRIDVYGPMPGDGWPSHRK